MTAIRAVVLASLLLPAALAGCFQGDEPSDGELFPALDPATLPPSCDGNRTAVAHGPGGEPRQAFYTLHPCLSKTGFISREPTIGATSSGAIFHYPAMTGDNTMPMGVAISHDQGESWQISLPNVAGVPFHRHSVDPYLYVDPWTDRVFADDLATVNCSYSSFSDDDGATWTPGIAGCMETDHQSIFSGPPVTSTPIGYENIVYRCAINVVALGAYGTMSTCQKSIDGGLTWLPPGEPAFVTDPGMLPEICSGAHGHGIADEAGTIYLPKDHCEVPMLAISHDEGASWTRVAVNEDSGIRGHEAGVGVDPTGAIYYSWVAADGLPYFARSTDGGATWSEPIMMGPPGLHDAVFNQIYVGGEGKLAFAYMGTWQEPDDPERQYEAVLTVSYNAGLDDPTFYSAVMNDPEEDAFIVGNCCQGLQDFLDVVIGPDGTPWGAYIDDCLGPGQDCSTREILPGVEEALDTQREGAVGWFVGGPSLWDETDPNGPFPDEAP